MATRTRVVMGAAMVLAVCGWQDAVLAAGSSALSVRPVATYGTPAFPGRVDTTTVPEVLVVVSNAGTGPVALQSRDGRVPRFMVQCFLGPRRKPTEPLEFPLKESLPERIELENGDSLYLAVPVLFETVAFRIRLFLEPDSGDGYTNFMSDTLEVSDLPKARLIDEERALQAVLGRYPDVKPLPAPPALRVSRRHGKIWAVRVLSGTGRRVVFVGALSGEVLSGLELPSASD